MTTTMIYTTVVYTTIKVPGVHFWPEADQHSEHFKFLAHPHRHIFHIKVTMCVGHHNRAIEFLDLQDQVVNSLKSLYNYFEAGGIYDFGTHSCERIASSLLAMMSAAEVEVSEDGENGAIVTQAARLTGLQKSSDTSENAIFYPNAD